MATCPVHWRTVSKGGDPRTDQEGTTRTPGWHPEEEVLSNQRGLRKRTPKGRCPKTLDSVCETPSRRTHPIRRCGVVLSYLIRYGWTVAHVSILVALLGPIIWDFHSYIFPFVSSASFSLLALIQTLRRHWCRLLRQRLNFSTPSRAVVTSDVVGSGKHWSRSDCRANNPAAGKARNAHPCPLVTG